MFTNVGNLNVGVKYKVDTASQKAVSNSFSSIKKSASSLTSTFKGIGKAAAAAFSVAAVTKFISTTTKAYEVQITAETKLATVMRQRMHATNAQIQAVKDLASTYQGLGVIGDEVALSGIAQLATFTKEAKSLETVMGGFESALVGMYGLNATAQNATQLANQLGKALANGQLSALTRSGMTFTEAEKSAFEMASELERAEILSQALTNNYGKLNEVMAQTPLGKMKQLSNAWGDVMEKFGSAFANIGAIFVPALMKVVSWLDGVASMLSKVSEAIARIFGTKYVKNQTAAVSETTEGLGDLSEGYETAGKAAKKASESLASFDNTVQLSSSSDSSGGGASGGSLDSPVSVGGIIEEEVATSEIDSLMGKIKGAFSTMGGYLSQFFDFKKLNGDISSIKESLGSIFSDIKPDLSLFFSSAGKTLISAGENLLQVAGSVVGSFVSGVEIWLREGKERIASQWGEIFSNFTITSDNIREILDLTSESLSEFFNLESTKEAIANALTSLEGMVSGSTLLISNLWSDLSTGVRKTIEENFGGIKTFLERVSGILQTITGTVKDIILDCFDSINKNYEKYVKPAWENFQSGFSYAVSVILDTYNNHVLPFIQNLADAFRRLWNDHLAPFVDEVVGIAGAFIEMVSAVYNKAIRPLVDDWSEAVKVITGVLDSLLPFFEGLVADIADILGGLARTIKGIFETITGILTGDTAKATEGMKNIFSGLGNSVVTIFARMVNGVIDAINVVIRGLNKLEIPGTDVGVNIRELSRWTPPKFAEGGIVYRETNFGDFIAGEGSKAEAIVPLENSRYTKVLASEIVKGMVESGFGSGATYNIENAFGDERSIERLVNKISEVEARMNARKGVVSYG